MKLDIRIEKVENGYIVSVSGGYEPFGAKQLVYVFNTWESATGFISSLNDKFK